MIICEPYAIDKPMVMADEVHNRAGYQRIRVYYGTDVYISCASYHTSAPTRRFCTIGNYPLSLVSLSLVECMALGCGPWLPICRYPGCLDGRLLGSSVTGLVDGMSDVETSTGER